MFGDLVSNYEVQGLTLEAVRSLTGLSWVRVDQKSDIPIEPGVYGWFDPTPPNVMVYHGSGSGAGGLYGRLANQFRWQANHRDRMLAFDLDPTEDNGYERAAESPVIREYTERGLVLYAAVAAPASWVVPTSLATPANAIEWETFIYSASHLATGRRSILGGGAWENKSGSLAEHMASVAWDRMVAVSEDWRK